MKMKTEKCRAGIWKYLLCFLIALICFLPRSVRAETEDVNMQWKTYTENITPDCEVGNNFLLNSDAILAKSGGDISLTLAPKEGYAIYYRKFQRGSYMLMTKTRCKEMGLVDESTSKTLVFEYEEKHTDKTYNMDCYPFTYIVLKKDGEKYFTKDGTEFDVENAETAWKYVPLASTYKDDDSWFYGFVGQTPQENLYLDSAKISNLSGTEGESLEFKETTLNYKNLVVNNGKDMTLTAAVDWSMGGSVEYKIDGGETVYPDSEGRITIPGISEVGGQRTVQATTVPLEENAFDHKSQTYTFTITRGKASAPLKNLSAEGIYKQIEFQEEIYEYNVAVENTVKEVTLLAEGSKESVSLQYQVDDGERQDLPENGKISVSVENFAQPVVRIYTTAQAESELFQDGVYTVQILQKRDTEDILDRAAMTEKVMSDRVKNGSTLDTADSPWAIMELKTYGTDLESLGVTKESYMASRGIQKHLSLWDNHGGYFQEKAVMGLLATGWSLDELSMIELNGETVNLVQDDFLANFASLWALTDDNFREYLGEDVVLQRARDLIAKQTEAGEYSDSHTGGTDGTAMSIQAFSTWYGVEEDVTASVNKALDYLSGLQDKATGLVGYAGYGYYSSETISQWIVALCSIGIDPNEAEDFTSDYGLGLVDILIDYFMLDTGEFEHIQGEGANGMATEQAFRALAAYKAFLENNGEKTFVFNVHTTQPWTGTEAVAAVVKDIDAIGEVTMDSADTIEKARTGYDALSEAEKNSMPLRYAEKLTQAEEDFAPFRPAAEVRKMIAAIGAVTLDKEEAIQAAKDAYDKLTEEQKAQVDNLSVLEAAIQALEADKATVAAIQKKLDELPDLEDVTLEIEEQVQALQKEIQALRQDMQDALEGAEQVDAILQRIVDLKDAQSVEALIDAIGTVTSLEQEAAVLEAQKAYEALSAEAKALLQEGYKEKLDEAAAAIQELKDNAAVQNVIENINKLLDEDGELNVTLEDGDFLADVRGLYDQVANAGLGDRVTNRDILFQAEEAYAALLVDKVTEQIKALPDNEKVTGKAEDGSDIVMTQEQLDSILAAQTAYEALTAEQKTQVEEKAGEEAMENYRLDVKTAETYSGYIEAVLSVFVKKIMDLQLPLTNANINSAKKNLEAAQALIEQYENNEAAQTYLNSVEGFKEKIEKIEAEILKVNTDLADALAVDELIGKLPDKVSTKEERDQAQAAVDAVWKAYEALNKDAQNYVIRLAEVSLTEALIANFDKYTQEVEQVEAAIQKAVDSSKENLTSDATVEAVMTAQRALEEASVTAKEMISEELKSALAALPASIQNEKNEALSENSDVTIQETVPYDVTVELSLVTSGAEYEALKEAFQKEKADIADAVKIFAYQLVWNAQNESYEKQEYLPQGGFTITLKTENDLSGKEVLTGQYQEQGEVNYLTATAGDGQVTFKADALTVYALGLKEKAGEAPGDDDNKGDDDKGDDNQGGGQGTTPTPTPTPTGTGSGGKTVTTGSGSSGTTSTTAGGSSGVPKTGDTLAWELEASWMLLIAAAAVLIAAGLRKRERNR